MTPAAARPLAAHAAAAFELLAALDLPAVVLEDHGAGVALRHANAAATALLGYTVDELARIPPLELIAPELRPKLRQLAEAARSGPPRPATLGVTVVRKDAARVELALTIAPARTPDGVAYAAIARDGASPAPALLAVLEADRLGLVGVLAAGFAHEINNPLTSMLLTVRSARRQLTAAPASPTTAAVLRGLDDVTAGAERIAGSVRALQRLATHGGAASLDLAAVASAALRLAAPTLEPRAHVIRDRKSVV